MIRLLLFCISLILYLMHCIISLLAQILLFYTLDHTEPKMEVQVEQVQCVFKDPQASSCEDANIVGSRKALVHYTTIIDFVLN
jgi:hypothetical protein